MSGLRRDLDRMAAARQALYRAGKKVYEGEIDEETPLMPEAIADSVIDEVDRFVAPDEVADRNRIADELGVMARRIYKANEQFRKQMKARGNMGRDQLYVWMRHWLCSELQKHQPSIGKRLPDSFCMGQELLQTSGTTAAPPRGSFCRKCGLLQSLHDREGLPCDPRP